MASPPQSAPQVSSPIDRAQSNFSAKRLKGNTIHRLNGETKAQYLWRLLRVFVRKRLDKVTKDELEDMYITHGITKLKHIQIGSKVKSLCYNLDEKQFVSLDYDDYISFYKTDGRFTSSHFSYDNSQDQTNKFANFIQPIKPYDQIVYCAKHKQYIGWKHGVREIFIFNKTFELLSTSKSLEPVECLSYEPITGDIITSSSNGDMVIWNFRYNAKYLIPKQTHRNCLDTKFTYNFMILEPSQPRMTRCYFATNISVVVVNAFDGAVLSVKEDLHIRAITAITLFLPMRYVITASKEGAIKVWDQSWSLKMVFVGHNDAVLSLVIHPFAPYVISSSGDRTLRVWSLDQQDIVDKIDVEEPIDCIITERNYAKFLTTSGENLSLWKIDHIYEMITNIGRKINSIKQVDPKTAPMRTIVQCETGGLHIVNPASGHVLTSLLMDNKTRIVDTIYAMDENFAIACLDNGTLLKIDTTVNPCKIVHKNEKYPKKISKMLLYEFSSESPKMPVLKPKTPEVKRTDSILFSDDEDDDEDVNRQSKVYQALRTRSSKDLIHIKLKSFDRTLIFAGSKDGSISVVRWDNLELDYEIEMHNNREVSQLVANVKENQIISAGLDLVIKIWRVFPYVVECLSLLRTIFLPYQPKLCCLLRNRLCVAFNDTQTFTYSLKFFNTETNDKYEHRAALDHTEPIIAICSSEKLKIVASAGLDGTVRLWNINCEFLRCINLKEKPTAMTFSSSRADIFIGIGNHLFRMDHKSYLPKLVLFKMISMQFNDLEKEEPLPYAADMRAQLTKTGMLRLQSAHKNLLRYASAKIKTTNPKDEEEIDKDLLDVEMQSRLKGISVLNDRDIELRRLYRGEIKPTKARMKKRTAEEAFNNYMKLYFDSRRKPKIRDREFYEIDGEIFPDKTKLPTNQSYGDYELNTFFPSIANAQTTKPYDKLVEDYDSQIQKYTKKLIETSDFEHANTDAEMIAFNQDDDEVDDEIAALENTKESRVANESYFDQSIEPCNTTAVSIPPIKFTRNETSGFACQLKAPYFITGGFIPNSILIRILWTSEQLEAKDKSKVICSNDIPEDIEDDEDEKYRYDDGDEFVREAGKASILGMADDYYNRRAIKTRTPTPSPPTPPPILKPRHANIDDRMAHTAKMKHEMENEILDRQKAARIAREQREAEEKRRIEAELRAAEEAKLAAEEADRLRAIKEKEDAEKALRKRTPTPKLTIIDTTWFKRYFTAEQVRNLPKKTSHMAVEVLKRAVDVLADDKEVLEETTFMLEMLSTYMKEDSLLVKDRKNMEPVANNIVKLMRKIPLNSKEAKHQDFVISCLHLTGDLGDPVRSSIIEWMYWFIEGTEKLRRNVRQLFNASGICELGLFFYEELDSWETWKIEETLNRRDEIIKLCTDWLAQWTFSFELHLKETLTNINAGQFEARVSQHGKELLQANAQKNAKKLSDGVQLKVERKRERHIGYVSPIECINYFCEMMHEAEKLKIEKMKIEKDELNTVLIMPTKTRNTFLIRLGDSNTDLHRPSKSEVILPPVRVPAKYKQGDLMSTTHINLPLRQVYIHPFDANQPQQSNIDMDFLNEYNNIERAFDLLTLRTSQKYFVLKNSYSIK